MGPSFGDKGLPGAQPGQPLLGLAFWDRGFRDSGFGSQD